MTDCFENAAELMDFYRANQSAFAQRFAAQLAQDRPVNLWQRKNCAYCAAKDFIFESNFTATDCQLYKLAEIMAIGGEKNG